MSAKLDFVLGREDVRNASTYLARALVDSEQILSAMVGCQL